MLRESLSPFPMQNYYFFGIITDTILAFIDTKEPICTFCVVIGKKKLLARLGDKEPRNITRSVQSDLFQSTHIGPFSDCLNNRFRLGKYISHNGPINTCELIHDSFSASEYDINKSEQKDAAYTIVDFCSRCFH